MIEKQFETRFMIHINEVRTVELYYAGEEAVGW
jgi:hypothetical protein